MVSQTHNGINLQIINEAQNDQAVYKTCTVQNEYPLLTPHV